MKYTYNKQNFEIDLSNPHPLEAYNDSIKLILINIVDKLKKYYYKSPAIYITEINIDKHSY